MSSSIKILIVAATVLASLAAVSAARANNLVYHPIHPTFGGIPTYDAWLFGLANGQNWFGDSSGGGNGGTGGTGGIGGSIGGPVIIVNPGKTTVNPPDTEAGVDQVD